MHLKTSVRSALRDSAVELGAIASTLSSTAQQGFTRPRVHFLYFHALAPRDTIKFRRMLDKLSADHTFLSYSDAVKTVQRGPIDRPYIAFSFDDGLKSNIEVARILASYQTTGMFFVPPAIIGNGDIDDVQRFYRYAPEVQEITMDWAELAQLKSEGHEVGNHTLSHNSLSQISESAARDEIYEGAEAIRRELGSCEHFAWPRGAFRHFPARLKDAVFDSGHSSCASGVRGAHVAVEENHRELCIRRELVASYWPVRHSLFFVQRSARNATPLHNAWPE